MERLFSKAKLLLLSVFYTNPTKSFYMHELGEILGKKPGVFQRALNSLVEAELLTAEYRANARFFKANTKQLFYPELRKIILKSAGPETALRDLLSQIKDVRLALIYGSFAKRTERAASDIDLLIVANPDAEGELLKKIPRIEKSLQRDINYKLYSEQEYRQKRRSKDAFLEEVLSDKFTILKGSPNDI